MAENKFETREMLARCVPMSRLQGVLGGKWKILILWYVAFYRIQRFGELMRRLDGVTPSSLPKSLRGLEEGGFVPVLNSMMAWSAENLCPPGYVSPCADPGGAGPADPQSYSDVRNGREM